MMTVVDVNHQEEDLTNLQYSLIRWQWVKTFEESCLTFPTVVSWKSREFICTYGQYCTEVISATVVGSKH